MTHVLTGACLARTGLNRRAAYATAGMALAAEFTDIDTVCSLRGPVSGFVHHRGITHTFLGVPFEAAFLLLVFVVWHRLRRPAATPRSGCAPVRWLTLYLLLCLALLSHLLLDYTNNYGLRPFLPFNPQWYAGSIVFIFDPLLFVLLVAGLAMPSLFSLVHREVGGRKEAFRGRGWARGALLGVVTLWAVRAFEHGRAVALADAQTLRAPAPFAASGAHAVAAPADVEPGQLPPLAPEVRRAELQAKRSLASPDPLSIFRWYTVTDFGPVYRLGVADSRKGTWEAGELLQKAEPGMILQAAEATALGRAYLGWSPMPAIAVSDAPTAETPATGTEVVTFRDPRFMGATTLLHPGGRTPLTGEVVLRRDGHVLAEGIDGKFQP